MKTISLERIRELKEELDAIDQLNIVEVTILKDNKPVDISARMRLDLRFTGQSTFQLLQQIDKQQK